MEHNTSRQKFVIVTQPTPEKMDEMAKQPGFLRFQFQHPSGQWKNVYPMRPDVKPLTRAVFNNPEL